MKYIRAVHLTALALLSTSMSCVGILSSRRADSNPDSEPPRSWPAAIQFQFQDTSGARAAHTTRIEFHNGNAVHAVTNRDLISANNGRDLITPWYRLSPPKKGSLNLRVWLHHPGGSRTTADYPLPVHRDNFYTVVAAVYRRDPSSPPWVGMPMELRGYPLHPAAIVRPGDSLWIAFQVRSKDCSGCVR